MCTYDDVVKLLEASEFGCRFYDKFWDADYAKIGHGRKEVQGLKGMKAVEESFWNLDPSKYVAGDEQKGRQAFSKWREELQRIPFDLCTVCSIMEILDWGKVAQGNLRELAKMIREKRLEETVGEARKYFASDDLYQPNVSLRWSSGWTKIYSFACDNVCIYDSRCAAFLNYAVLACVMDDDCIKKLACVLLSFSGDARGAAFVREVNNHTRELYGFQSQSNLGGMRANKCASWILRYLAGCIPDNSIRDPFGFLDRCAFMLGYDIGRLPETGRFKLIGNGEKK